MRGEPNVRPQRGADFSDGRLDLPIGRVADSSVLDVQPVEPMAIALFVPAEVIVETEDIICSRARQRLAIVFFDLGLELREPPFVNEVLEPGDFAIGPVAVIALGKWGGLELNYSSDIDLFFVADDRMSMDELFALRREITSVLKLLSLHTEDGFAFRTDARLRPEGPGGPLIKTVRQCAIYYDRYAHPGEFTPDDWNDPDFRTLGMLVHGRSADWVDRHGRTVEGATLLLLVNGDADACRFSLPRPTDGGSWVELVSSSNADQRATAAGPEHVAAFSLALLEWHEETR